MLPPLSTLLAPGLTDVAPWLADGRAILAAALAALGYRAAYLGGRLAARRARILLGQVVAAGRSRLRSLGARLVSGAIDQAAWYAGMARDVMARHSAAAMALLGPGPVGAAERAALAGRVSRQFAYLDRFRAQLQAEQVAFADALAARSAMYADAAWGTGYAVLTARMMATGKREARRVLEESVVHHCEDCPYLASLGWVPIREIVPIGETRCQSRCRCYIDTR